MVTFTPSPTKPESYHRDLLKELDQVDRLPSYSYDAAVRASQRMSQPRSVEVRYSPVMFHFEKSPETTPTKTKMSKKRNTEENLDSDNTSATEETDEKEQGEPSFFSTPRKNKKSKKHKKRD